MTRESALSDALQEWFDRAELVHHLKAQPYGEEILRQLPHGCSSAQHCDAVVDALKRRGLIDREFFEQLAAARPLRARQIQRLRAQWLVGAPLERGARWAGSRYRLDSLLGSGGFGQVWRAVDTDTGELVALKILHTHHAEDPYIRQRFARGAAVLSRLSHPAIVRVYSAIEQEGLQFFYVMEFIAGETVAQLVGHTATDGLLACILAIGDALDHVHAANFLHRDVKPSNILVSGTGKAQLIDFDLVSGAAFAVTTTRNLGTHLYSPPEAHTSDDKTRAYDVYGLARTVEFVLRGREPTVAEHQATDPVATLAASEAVKTALRCALRPIPGERTQTVRQFCDELRAALSAGPSPVTPPQPANTPTSPANAWPWWLRIIVSVTGITGGIAFVLFVIRELSRQEGVGATRADTTRPASEPPPSLPVAPHDPALDELRPHQRRVIEAVESALTAGQRRILVRMPLAVGRIHTLLALLRRSLTRERFARVLVLVNHTAETHMVRDRLRYLKLGQDVRAEPMRSMHHRLRRQQPDAAPAERHDCVVILDCHSDLAESLLSTILRGSNPVVLGLTASPAPSTLLSFGQPVATYSYAEAVEDGLLVPSTLHTIRLVEVESGLAAPAHRPTQPTAAWTRHVCKYLAEHIDPAAPGKTLIFAASSRHADEVVDQLNQAMVARHGTGHGDVAAAITSEADRSRDLFHRYKNEARPSIAVTANLSAGDIYVPAICNLVLLRQVRSPELFEQVIVQASRLCPEVGKRALMVHDAVGLDLDAFAGSS
jgi:serine/threonine protein kinase